MITYRPATEADLPLVTDQVIALTMQYKDAFKTPCFDLTVETVKDNILAFIEDYIIVLRDCQTVAFYLLGDEFGLTHLEELIVLPQYRNQGIGSEVVKTIMPQCTMALMVTVLTANTGAVRFFERLGFQKCFNNGLSTMDMVWNPQK